MEARVIIAGNRNGRREKIRKLHFMYTSSKKPVFRCILHREGRGHPCTCRWRCTPGRIHPIDLLHAGHQVVLLNGQWSDWALHFQLQPGNGFAPIRSNSGSSWRCNVGGFLREENAVVCSAPDEVEGRRGTVCKVMVARKHGAGSEGMYRLAIIGFGVGVQHSDGRGIVEDVGGIPTRYRNAGHAGGVIEIGDCSKGGWNGRRVGIRRASVVLGVSVKKAMGKGEEEISAGLLAIPVQVQHDRLQDLEKAVVVWMKAWLSWLE